MSSSDDETPGGNVIDFGRRTGLTGFNMTPIGPGGGDGPQGSVIPPAPTAPPGTGTGGRIRRSPLDAIAALPSPTLTAPPVVATPSPSGGLPDTFRGAAAGGGSVVGPPLGALSVAACLAIAVAALRGACHVLEDRRQRRLEKQAETAPLREARAKHQLAMEQARFGAVEAAAKNGLAADQAAAKHATTMQGIGDKAAEQRAKNKSKVPSSQEFDRKALAGRGGASGGKGAGAGTGTKSASSGTGPGRGSKGVGLGAGKGSSGGGKSPASKTGLGAGAKKGSTKPSTGSGAAGKGAGKGAGAGLKKQDSKNAGGLSKNGRKDAGAAAAQKKTPLGGKQAASSATSPAMERARRRRQDRRDAGQAAKLKRRAAADAARHKEQAKDNKAARDQQKAAHGQGLAAKKARQDAKDRIRNGRLEAKEGRKEQARQGKFDTKQQQKAQKTAEKEQKKDAARTQREQAKAAAGDRTTLWDALKKDTADSAGGRWAKRNGVPPLWKNDHRRQKKTADAQDAPTTGPGAKTEQPKQAAPGPSRGERWRRARDRARWLKDGCFGGTGGAGATGAAGTAGPTASDTNTPGPAGTPPGASARTGGGQRTGRKSPFQNAASSGPTTVTVDRPDRRAHPGDDGPIAGISRGIDALPPAPESHTQRPGTTRPKEPIVMPPAIDPSQDPRLQKARNQATRRAGAVTKQARHMDAQHATEITLDDALDEYGHFKDDAFKTHRQCEKLSRRARRLASTLEDFAEELAVSHNLIGAMFTGAMASLSESMELVASMADEMEISSLQAAEMSETADNELNDAYRPISQATADAGLTTPSAPVHNRT